MKKDNELPERTADTMSMAIALSSPSGRMSKRARAHAEKQLARALFGDYVRPAPPQPSPIERLTRQADSLREIISRGMTARKYKRELERLESEIAKLKTSSE